MEESILASIRRAVGLPTDYTEFDQDLIMYANTVFVALTQLGVGPEEGFQISDDSTTWNDYLQSIKLLNSAKTYLGVKVRLAFDPPTSSILMEALKEVVKEAEFRITITVNESARGDDNGK